MAEEEAQVSETAQDMESRIKPAMISRVSYFKEQADSLTFEGVRRLLEEDLGLEKFALDVNKRFVKQCLLECLANSDDANVSKNSEETEESGVGPRVSGELESKKDKKETISEDEKMEDSPVMGLLTGNKRTKTENADTQDTEKKQVPSESMIRKALRKRVPYFKDNSENITMVGVRRLLEEDLQLDKNTLDPYKTFIREQLDEVLESLSASEPTTLVKKKNVTKNSRVKASAKVESEGSSGSSESESEEEEKAKPVKKMGSKVKTKKSEGVKRKRPAKETEVHSKKRSKLAETISKENSDVEDGGSVSDGGDSQSSLEKPAKKKEAATPVYGKRVEHLKSIIKACGMSVPPVIYKRVKQAPENKRESSLIKELEEILSKEGLSSNPSEKDIKDVRKKKDRAKELEGIDMSNIVSSSRRRSTTSFVAPPKPKITVESNDDDANAKSSSESEEDDDGGEDDNDDENGDNDENESQSEEEFEEDNDDDSD